MVTHVHKHIPNEKGISELYSPETQLIGLV